MEKRRNFKNGDFVRYKDEISLFKEYREDGFVYWACYDGCLHIGNLYAAFEQEDFLEMDFATEEEVAKLSAELIKKGFQWNPFTKELTKVGFVKKNYDEHPIKVDEKPQYEVGGNHYQMAIQPIDFIMKNKLPFCEGNVVKYITRHKNKNHAEDVEKAISYCVFILKNEYDYTDENIKSMFNK